MRQAARRGLTQEIGGSTAYTYSTAGGQQAPGSGGLPPQADTTRRAATRAQNDVGGYQKPRA